ncbi:hypothetical protein [[Mycobacterium] wendilense]|uniref:DsrE/DsrF-like family protein n=1 Tax=[Mycobacterium] wendilense TaxID=3064284 RepID=A0ABM9MB55_9MYCO|nr:hypothetical protein [Mycolicibacterium sp. MU0050]CAJ1580911.1 hypothetical protein MU0050_001267 [Mycolicibacterium sp. MU0050]
MKLLKSLMLAAALAVVPLGIAGTAAAQPPSPEEISATENAIRPDGRYALAVSEPGRLNVAIMTGRDIKAKSPHIDFQIVTYGKVAQDLATDPAVQEAARRAVLDDGIKIVICDLPLDRLGIDRATLPVEFATTPNALTYLFGLQEQGYKTLTY